MKRLLIILSLLTLPLLTLACLTQTSIAGASPPATSPYQAVPPSTLLPDRCARVTADSLHVRYEADYHAHIAGWFTKDTVLKIKDDTNLWWKVYGPGIDAWGRDTHLTGFVKSTYLEETLCVP